MCAPDMRKLGVSAGDVITVASRRGEVAIHLRRDDGTPQGAVFIPFAYYEAAANLLTNAALDPVGKIPEFKYCAVAVTPGGTLRAAAGYGTGAVEVLGIGMKTAVKQGAIAGSVVLALGVAQAGLPVPSSPADEASATTTEPARKA